MIVPGSPVAVTAARSVLNDLDSTGREDRPFWSAGQYLARERQAFMNTLATCQLSVNLQPGQKTPFRPSVGGLNWSELPKICHVGQSMPQ